MCSLVSLCSYDVIKILLNVVYRCDITFNSVIGTIIQPIYTCYIPNILQHDYIVLVIIKSYIHY